MDRLRRCGQVRMPKIGNGNEETELQHSNWGLWSFPSHFTMSIVTVTLRCSAFHVILSASTRWHLKRPHSFTHPLVIQQAGIGSYIAGGGNRGTKKFTVTRQTPVSFPKCFAERELHGPPDLLRGLQGKEKTQDLGGGLCGEPFYTMVIKQGASPRSKTSLHLQENQTHRQWP